MSLRAVEHVFTGDTVTFPSYDSTKTSIGSLMTQNSGTGSDDNYVGPFPVAIARPLEESTQTAMMMPHAITFSDTIDWVFLTQNAVTAASARQIFLYEYDKTLSSYNWKGFITINLPTATANTTRGFRALRYLHTTGTISVGAPTAVTTAGTVQAVIAGTVTNSGSNFLISHVGMMIGFGSTTPSQISCWYPIISFSSATVITVSGISSPFAAGTSYVIASCTVTGVNTKFVTEGIAAGCTTTGLPGMGLGPRIGFGNTDPTQIAQWYQIGFITDDTHLNIVTSPGVVESSTAYVIEELRFAFAITNATAVSGGVVLIKGAGYLDFTTAGITLPFIASAIDNQRGGYWLSDAGTPGNIVTNTTSCGLEIDTEVNKGLHYAYVLDGVGSTFMRCYRYNLRATGTIASGKMTMSIAYYTTGTVSNSGTAITGVGTTFTISMTGKKIGFGSTSPARITTWFQITAFTDTTHITVDSSPGTLSGVDYVIDSADVISTGPQLVTGTVIAVNNGRLGTLQHGPGNGILSLYFVTGTRIYRAAISNIWAGNLGWISDNRIEIPPGSANTFPASGILNTLEVADAIDRLIILTLGTSGSRQYVTRYPSVSGVTFDGIFGIDDKQQDQSAADSNSAVHFSTDSQPTSVWSQNGVAHIIKHGGTAALCQMYALPISAHWLFASSTSQQVITPAISTPNCNAFTRVMTSVVDHLGDDQFRVPTASVLVYYRTSGITDNSGSWTAVDQNGDLSGTAAAENIQFMMEYVTFGILSVPGRVMSIAVLYDDLTTDTHYQVSAVQTVAASKQFAWRFSTAFGSSPVPTLRIRLYDAVTGGLLVDDDSVTQANTWGKSTNDGVSYGPYDTSDKINETTYISFTPATLPDSIKVRPLLTLL